MNSTTDSRPFLNSRVLPETGERIVCLSIRAGVLSRTGPFTVHTRNGYALTDEEYGMSDGCRHHVKGLYPNDPTGGPERAPWSLFQNAACSIQAREGIDEKDALRILVILYAAQCRKVASEMREAVAMLESWANTAH